MARRHCIRRWLIAILRLHRHKELKWMTIKTRMIVFFHTWVYMLPLAWFISHGPLLPSTHIIIHHYKCRHFGWETRHRNHSRQIWQVTKVRHVLRVQPPLHCSFRQISLNPNRAAILSFASYTYMLQNRQATSFQNWLDWNQFDRVCQKSIFWELSFWHKLKIQIDQRDAHRLMHPACIPVVQHQDTFTQSIYI